MSKMDTNKKHYKLSGKIIVEEEILEKETEEENVSIGRMIVYFGILAIICISSFLIAKYIVRRNIGWEETPIDTSERL